MQVKILLAALKATFYSVAFSVRGFMDVMLISKSEVDWDNYLLAAKKVMGRPITRIIESRNIDPINNNAFILTLKELKDEKAKYQDNPGSILQHCFYTFLAAAKKEILLELFEHSKLGILTTPCEYGLHIIIMSGNLETWRNTAINCCSELVSFECRLLVNKIILIFEYQEGIIFSEYKKEGLKDTTFKLGLK